MLMPMPMLLRFTLRLLMLMLMFMLMLILVSHVFRIKPTFCRHFTVRVRQIVKEIVNTTPKTY